MRLLQPKSARRQTGANFNIYAIRRGYITQLASNRLLFEYFWTDLLGNIVNITFEYITVISVDNSAATELASNPTFHKKTKVIDIRTQTIRDRNELGITAQE